MPLLVNPRKNMSTANVGLLSANIPTILIIKSTITITIIIFPKGSLSPRHPQINVPTTAVTVLMTRQYPRKWSSLMVSMKMSLKLERR